MSVHKNNSVKMTTMHVVNMTKIDVKNKLNFYSLGTTSNSKELIMQFWKG